MCRYKNIVSIIRLLGRHWLLLTPAFILFAAMKGTVSDAAAGWILGVILTAGRQGNYPCGMIQLFIYLVILLGIGGVIGVCQYVIDTQLEHSRNYLQILLLSRILHIPLARLSQEHTGEYCAYLSVDTEKTIASVNKLALLIATLLFSNLLSLFTIYTISLPMGWYTLGVGAMSLLLNGCFAPYMRKIQSMRRTDYSNLMVKISDLLSGYMLRTTDDQHSFFLRRVLYAVQSYFVSTWKTKKISMIASMPAEISRFLIDGILIAVGAMLVSNQQLAASQFMTVWTLGTGIGFSMRKLANTYFSVQEGLTSVDRVCDVLRRNTVEYGTKSIDAIKNNEIKFSNVSFSYNKSKTPVCNLSCVIPANRMTAIIGPSGVGKSTLIHLLMRLYDPDIGSITIGGIDVRDLTAEALNDLITYVPQSPLLFSGTLRENLVLYKPDAKDDEIWTVLQSVQMDTYVKNAPGGLDSEVGENGGQLSGGERQRIALARAFLNDAPILILDEPTSGLDDSNRKSILAQISSMRKTIIVITHDSDIIAKAPHIIQKLN